MIWSLPILWGHTQRKKYVNNILKRLQTPTDYTIKDSFSIIAIMCWIKYFTYFTSSTRLLWSFALEVSSRFWIVFSKNTILGLSPRLYAWPPIKLCAWNPFKSLYLFSSWGFVLKFPSNFCVWPLIKVLYAWAPVKALTQPSPNGTQE